MPSDSLICQKVANVTGTQCHSIVDMMKTKEKGKVEEEKEDETARIVYVIDF